MTHDVQLCDAAAVVIHAVPADASAKASASAHASGDGASADADASASADDDNNDEGDDRRKLLRELHSNVTQAAGCKHLQGF